MCGIAGIWGTADERLIQKMKGILTHRGPDAEGTHKAPEGRGVLGHRRLSIMDPQGGNQPIYGGSRHRAIVANGEFYSHPELKEELSEQHRYRTGSDVESALHLYEEVGEETAGEMDGMFAFAMADGTELYLARDAIGIKPLYLGERQGHLVFASELKALTGLAENVREFPPGTWYHSRNGFHRYYNVPDREPVSRPLAEHLKAIRKTLERGVVKRLMSDVPVGAFLSGGLDSSLIAALARRHLDELHTFSVGIEGSRDLEAARIVARHLDTVHHEYVFTVEEVLDELPRIVYHLESFDQDLVRSAIPCHFTSRLAAEEVKVILTGEGADELFAGYDYYKNIFDPETLHQELRRSVCALHNVNLQRVDRLTMAHSIEGRVPFLDTELIELAQTIPPELKLTPQDDGQRLEKWILRKACEDLLPAEILWRDKEQFDEGSGTVDVLAEGLRQWMNDSQAQKYADRFPDADLRSPEECLYHKLLSEAYPDPSAVLANVARWSDRPVAV